MEKRKYVTGDIGWMPRFVGGEESRQYQSDCPYPNVPALWAESFTYGELLFTFGAEGKGL